MIGLDKSKRTFETWVQLSSEDHSKGLNYRPEKGVSSIYTSRIRPRKIVPLVFQSSVLRDRLDKKTELLSHMQFDKGRLHLDFVRDAIPFCPLFKE